MRLRVAPITEKQLVELQVVYETNGKIAAIRWLRDNGFAESGLALLKKTVEHYAYEGKWK